MSKYKILKEHLRETLAAGAAIGVDIKQKGAYAMTATLGASPPPYWGLCLLGTVDYVTRDPSDPPASVATRLGLTFPETKALEAGFCGWARSENDSPDLYRLGRSLAREFATDYKSKRS